MSADTSRGMTPRQAAKILRVSPDKIRLWIRKGELSAINTAANCLARPRYIILPHHLYEWEQKHRAATPEAKAPPRRKKRTDVVVVYPD